MWDVSNVVRCEMWCDVSEMRCYMLEILLYRLVLFLCVRFVFTLFGVSCRDSQHACVYVYLRQKMNEYVIICVDSTSNRTTVRFELLQIYFSATKVEDSRTARSRSRGPSSAKTIHIIAVVRIEPTVVLNQHSFPDAAPRRLSRNSLIVLNYKTCRETTDMVMAIPQS